MFYSTALLLHELNSGSNIDTCYFKLSNNQNSQNIELKNRKKILKHVSHITHDKSFSGTLGHDFVYDLYSFFDGKDHMMLLRAYMWIQFLILKADLSKYDRIVFGYVKYDDFWHFKHEILDIYDRSFKMTSYNKEKPKLVYPFEWITKTNISCWYDTKKYYNTNVKKYIKKIKKLTVYCETPINGKSCKKCTSCKRHKNELGKK